MVIVLSYILELVILLKQIRAKEPYLFEEPIIYNIYELFPVQHNLP